MLESGFWVEGTAGAKIRRQGYTGHARGQGEGKGEGEHSRWSLYWDTDIGQLCLLPEPTVLTTVVHILIPRKYNTGERELFLREEKSQAVSSSSSGKTLASQDVMEERGLGGNRFFRPNQVRFHFIRQS